MKKLLIIVFLVTCPMYLFSQVVFDYDAAGNRISRHLLELKSTIDSSEVEMQYKTFPLDEEVSTLVFPNPTTGTLNIEIDGWNPEENIDIKVRVYTTDGSLVFEDDIHNPDFAIDLSAEADGTYLLDLSVNNKKQHFTIIKQ